MFLYQLAAVQLPDIIILLIRKHTVADSSRLKPIETKIVCITKKQSPA